MRRHGSMARSPLLLRSHGVRSRACRRPSRVARNRRLLSEVAVALDAPGDVEAGGDDDDGDREATSFDDRKQCGADAEHERDERGEHKALKESSQWLMTPVGT